jgi:hypothetical protein
MGTVTSWDDEQPVVVLSLSASGAMIQAQDEPRLSAAYTLNLSLHNRHYELPFQVVHWIRQGDTYGWRGPFQGLSTDQEKAIERAVHAAAGLITGSRREWPQVASEAEQLRDQKVLVGTTPAGGDIAILGHDVLEMGPDGVELYARLLCELETL